MASEQLTKSQVTAEFKVPARNFEYNFGTWEKPTWNDETAKLISGHKIAATTTVSTFVMKTKTVVIDFTLGKPMESSGWERSQLKFKAELGSKSVVLETLAQRYRAMPAGTVSTFRISLNMQGNTVPATNKLHLTLYDNDTTSCKSGLVFYGAVVMQSSGSSQDGPPTGCQDCPPTCCKCGQN